jgi:hypothetical protein
MAIPSCGLVKRINRFNPGAFVLRAWVLSFFAAAQSFAATLNVPAEYPSIYDAVIAAADGDSIVVAPGTYVEETIEVTGRRLFIIGAGRDATFLSSNHFVGFQIRDQADVAMMGFDVTSDGGIGAAPSFIVAFATLSISECRIHDSSGGGTGGGAITAGTDANIYCEDVLFLRNTGIVGAVDVTAGNTAHFTRCLFQDNTTNRSLNGAGGANIAARDVRVVDCDFINNRSIANFGGLVGGLHVSGDLGGTALIDGCLFVGNEGTDCGAILAQGGGSATIRQCTIDRNTGHKDNSAVGVGLSGSTTDALVENCIVTGNGPARALGCVASALTVSCCDIWGNTDDTVCPGGTNNISADPQFCGVAQWDIQADSPCAPGNNPTCGLIGARGVGCGVDVVKQATWGQVKALWYSR